MRKIFVFASIRIAGEKPRKRTNGRNEPSKSCHVLNRSASHVHTAKTTERSVLYKIGLAQRVPPTYQKIESFLKSDFRILMYDLYNVSATRNIYLFVRRPDVKVLHAKDTINADVNVSQIKDITVQILRIVESNLIQKPTYFTLS